MNRIPAIVASALIGCVSLVALARADAPPAAAEAAPRISQADLLARLEKKDAGVVVLDVRTPDEFAAGHVPGARNVSHDQLAARLGELDALRDKDVVLYCRSGRRTALAEDVLRKAGFTKLLHLDGDYLAWQAANQPIEKAGARQ
jgi:rhodanese-related sulfurtransferase